MTSKKLKPEALAAATSFAELPMPQGPCRTATQQAATVHTNDIYPGKDTELLKVLQETVSVC